DIAGINSTGTPGLIEGGSGGVTLMGNVIDLSTDASGNPTVTTTGAGPLGFQTHLVNRPIILGGGDVAGSLVYTDADNAAIAQGWNNGFSLITVTGGPGATDNPGGSNGPISTAKNV